MVRVLQKIMCVVAKNNPNYLDNEELAMDLTSLANDLYPGFARSVFIMKEEVMHLIRLSPLS